MDLVCKANPWSPSIQAGIAKVIGANSARAVAGEGQRTECAAGIWIGECRIEVTVVAMPLHLRYRNLVPQAGVDSEFPRDSPVILGKPREIRRGKCLVCAPVKPGRVRQAQQEGCIIGALVGGREQIGGSRDGPRITVDRKSVV